MNSAMQLLVAGFSERSQENIRGKSSRKKVDRVRRSLIHIGEALPADQEILEVWRKHAAKIRAGR